MKSKPKIDKAMTPQDVADVLGCQPEQAHEFVLRYWIVNGRKKFDPAAVHQVKERMIRTTTEDRRRQNRREREAGRIQ